MKTILSIEFDTKELDWDKTRYWFSVIYKEEEEEITESFCICEKGKYQATLLDSDGCPVEMINYKTLPKERGDHGENLFDTLSKLVRSEYVFHQFDKARLPQPTTENSR